MLLNSENDAWAYVVEKKVRSLRHFEPFLAGWVFLQSMELFLSKTKPVITHINLSLFILNYELEVSRITHIKGL